MIAFPLGGIAAGSISLGGRGQLRDWEIFNRPDKGRTPSYAFPSVWAQVDGSKPVVRVLKARLQPPYQAAEGLGPGNVPGLARMDGATFTGEFPLAQLEFHDRKLPERVRLEAFNPISPLDAEDSAHIRKTLASIYRNNYEPSLAEHESVQRIYALNDEAGVVICTYAPGKRPKIPFPYFAEVWTGFEYAFASLMLEHGMLEEGTRCIASARRRFDGERRNPWDETECGHHYARAMSAWSAMIALSGFHYSGPAKRIVVAPPSGNRLVSFYSTGASWGRFTHARSATATRFTIAPKYGTLAVSEVELDRTAARPAAVAVNKTSIPYQLRPNGDRVVIVISEPLSLTARDQLSVMV